MIRTHSVDIPVSPRPSWPRMKLLLLRLAASGWWRISRPSVTINPAMRDNRLTVEVVSHCWQYARLLRFQLESLVRYPPQEADLVVTVYFNQEDHDTVSLLEEFGAIAAPNIHWNWREIPQPALFRRAIGRNHAALNTLAQWVWFTDCDLVVSEGTLDELVRLLQGRTDWLVFPENHAITPLMSNAQLEAWRVGDSTDQDLVWLKEQKATGPLQIVQGDVARALGYCRDFPVCQAPAHSWQKAHEDRIFRWLLGTDGVPLPVPGVWRVGHAEKGRYQGAGLLGWLRKLRRTLWDIR